MEATETTKRVRMAVVLELELAAPSGRRRAQVINTTHWPSILQFRKKVILVI
jgi:hypothetical protein